MATKSDNNKLSRRQMLGTAAAAGAVGAAGGIGLAQDRHDRGGGANPPGAARAATTGASGREQVRGQARRARRILRVLLKRPDGRAPHRRAAVDARADARTGVQPRQRDGVGPDQREPEDPDRGAHAGEPRVPEGQGRDLHERRPPPPASVLHGGHLRRPLRVHERQVEHARRARAPRRHEVRQDRAAAEPVDGARPARPEVPEDRLRVLQRRGPGAAPERRQGARRPEAVPFDVQRGRRRNHEGRLAGHRRRQPRQRRRRLSGQVLLLDLLQLRGGRYPRRDDGEGAGLGRHLQPQAHRGRGQGRKGPDDGRSSGSRRAQRLALHALCPGPEQPARNQHGARRHPRRRRRQAVADSHRVRCAQVRRPVRRQDPAARHGRGGARNRFGSAAYGL